MAFIVHITLFLLYAFVLGREWVWVNVCRLQQFKNTAALQL